MDEILFFDVETSGLPKKYNAGVNEVDNWPKMVQIAWIVYKGQKEVSCNDYIVIPEGFKIPEDAYRIHGITNERANEEGFRLPFVLNKFNQDFFHSDKVVAHNINFDIKIVGAENYRLQSRDMGMEEHELICTMQSSTNFCQLPSKNGKKGYKWPKLAELHERLFGEGFDNAHDALADIRATSKCYFELEKQGVFKPKLI